MAERVPLVKFNNGYSCPILGLGTWQAGKYGEVKDAIRDAIDIGYRHIDCAHLYGNEKEIGEAIKENIDRGAVRREDLFVVSKLWNSFHRPDLVEKMVRVSLSDLGLEYLDLYLIHWPMAYKEGGDLIPFDENGKCQFSDVDYVDTWKAMEELVEKGLVKSIGLSNFNSKQIDRVLKVAKIKPVTNQVEAHPYLSQKKLFEFCKVRDITLTAYSPLGSRERPWANPQEVPLLDDPVIKTVADKYKKTPAQVLLRYSVDRGIIVVPKSSNKVRLAENFNIWDFQLTKEDFDILKPLDANIRYIPQDDAWEHKDHPFGAYADVEF